MVAFLYSYWVLQYGVIVVLIGVCIELASSYNHLAKTIFDNG
jgi:hypothetical protein